MVLIEYFTEHSRKTRLKKKGSIDKSYALDWWNMLENTYIEYINSLQIPQNRKAVAEIVDKYNNSI